MACECAFFYKITNVSILVESETHNHLNQLMKFYSNVSNNSENNLRLTHFIDVHHLSDTWNLGSTFEFDLRISATHVL